MASSIGIPVRLLYEAKGHVVTVELKTGEYYRGILFDVEDCMNIHLSDITLTARDGLVSKLDQCFLRGSTVRFIIVPDMLKNAPMFKNLAKTVATNAAAKAAKKAVNQGKQGNNKNKKDGGAPQQVSGVKRTKK